MPFALIPILWSLFGSGAPAAAAASGFPDREERLELFHTLVSSIESHHVFAPMTEKNLGRSWKEDLPRVEREFAEAGDLERLRAAINHLQNSLHNGHCWYSPGPGRYRLLSAGFRADVEWVEGKPVFFVSEVTDPALAEAMTPGDIVAGVDSVPAERFLEEFGLESNANNPRNLALDVARYLGERWTGVSSTREGDAVTVRLRKRVGGPARLVKSSWRLEGAPARDPRADPNGPIDYHAASCADLPDRRYGPYTLRENGFNWCLYASSQPPYDAYPIVRHFSFLYTRGPQPVGHLMRAERRALERAIASVSGAKAVVLDLRDNGGGNNVLWFLDWWAPGAFREHFVDLRLFESFDAFTAAEPVGMGPSDFEAYRAALDVRAPGQEFLRRPFFGRPDGCGADRRCVPAHRVTKLPIALLVGPGCKSSCDDFASVFHENELGPLVGEPTATIYALHARIPARLPRTGLDLGVIRVAFSREVDGVAGEDLEGRRLEIDRLVERTFDNRDRYDALLVDSAIQCLSEHSSGEGEEPPAPPVQERSP